MNDKDAMMLALEQARQAARLGEVPVGAVVLDAAGRLLATGHNRTIIDHDPSAHAEIVAMRAAALRVANHRLAGAQLYVTLEPCAMCMGAMFHARIARIVYGARDPKTGACGTVLDLSAQAGLNHHAHVVADVLADDCGDLLREFFRSRRGQGGLVANASPGAAEITGQQHGHTGHHHGVHGHAEHNHGEHHHGHDCQQHGHAGMPAGVYLISPSGALAQPRALELARANLQGMGFKVGIDRSARAVHERFAGTDRQRLGGIQRALSQKHSLVMATRGGYGLSRLLPHIDWQAVADSGKVFVGHSDFTAFSLALLARTGAPSLAGPAAVTDFGVEAPDELTRDLFLEYLSGELEILSFESPQADAVDARGILWGGNLAMLVSLLGTPYFPDVPGGILFLEDVGEHPFRVERMLTQLWHAGVLEKQQAILLGHFTEYRLAPHDNGYDMAAVMRWLRKTVKVPVVSGLPYGHVPVKACLPVGARVGVATEKGMAYLVLHEHHHA